MSNHTRDYLLLEMAGSHCHTTLILNHALWLGLFVFLIIFSIHFHPDKKVQLHFQIYALIRTHTQSFPSHSFYGKKCQNNYAK